MRYFKSTTMKHIILLRINFIIHSIWRETTFCLLLLEFYLDILTYFVFLHGKFKLSTYFRRKRSTNMCQ